MNQNVYSAFSREFEVLLDCLAETICVTGDEDWVSGDSPRHTPVHQACHCLAPIVRYLGIDVNTSTIDFRFKIPPTYPSRGHVLDILAASLAGMQVRRRRRRPDRGRQRAALSPLFKILYLLRHSVTHLSYMRDELHRRGYRLPVYTKSYQPKAWTAFSWRGRTLARYHARPWLAGRCPALH